MSRIVAVEDSGVYDTIEGVVALAKEVENLGLELGKVVVPTISLNASSLEIVAYKYTGAVSTGATFVPPAGTIVTMACFPDTPQNLNIMWGAYIVKAAAGLGATETGFVGAIYCDGIEVGFKNIAGTSKILKLEGYTLK